MFNINAGKKYIVTKVKTGVSQRGQAYTIMTIEDEPRKGQKFGDRLNVNVWGEDLGARIHNGCYISLTGASEVGLVFSKNPNDPTGKGYNNLTINCSGNHIHLETISEIDDSGALDTALDDLPF